MTDRQKAEAVLTMQSLLMAAESENVGIYLAPVLDELRSEISYGTYDGVLMEWVDWHNQQGCQIQ